MTAIRNRIANLALSLAAILIFFIFLELALALFWPHKITPRPFVHIQNFFCQYHPLMGWVNKPNYHDVVTVTRDFTFFVTHNSRGLRGSEHEYARVPGKYRILVLGDSFAWGFGVRDNEVFSQVLESLSPDVEVINMGVSGYGTDQELLLYTEEGYKYQPDLVILAFFSNDLDEISSSISYGYPKPFFLLDSQPLTVTNVPVPKTSETERKLFDNPTTLMGKLKKFLRRNTHSYPFLAKRINSIPGVRQFLLNAGLAEDQLNISGIRYQRLENVEQWWELLFRLINEFKTICTENKSRFLLMNIPLKESPAGKNLYPGVPPAEASSNDLISGRLKDFASHNNIDFINLLTPIRAGQARGSLYYSLIPRDIHLNAEGHRLWAETILQWIREKGTRTTGPS